MNPPPDGSSGYALHSVLQFGAVCCSVLKCADGALEFVLQCVVVLYSLLQCVAEWCSVLQCAAACCRVLQMQYVAVSCSVLQ